MPKQGSKSGKSSKTARVLNLLTDPESVEAPAEQDSPAEKGSSAKLADDRREQAKIRGALEGALEEELAETAPAPARPKRAKAPKRPLPPDLGDDEPEEPEEPRRDPAAATAPVLEDFSAPAGANESGSIPNPTFSVPKRDDYCSPLENTVNELRSAGEQKPDDYLCFNVMQALVEDKADKYIRMFGLCSCTRCRIDVIALALSNLPAKYVVAKPHDLIPRLSIYEQKYSAAVVTQVMSACRKVLERPHHQRQQC